MDALIRTTAKQQEPVTIHFRFFLNMTTNCKCIYFFVFILVSKKDNAFQKKGKTNVF